MSARRQLYDRSKFHRVLVDSNSVTIQVRSVRIDRCCEGGERKGEKLDEKPSNSQDFARVTKPPRWPRWIVSGWRSACVWRE